MTIGATPARLRATSATKPSKAGPARPTITPGLVQNCPPPSVIEAATCAATASLRAASAPGSTTIGLLEPISANTGMGCGRSRAMRSRAVPPANEPVKATARISGARTSAAPTAWSAPCSIWKVAAGSGERLEDRRDGVRDELAGARVGGVGLDHDGAAGRPRGGGVAAGDREREREVRRAEHRHRADRQQDAAQVGAAARVGAHAPPAVAVAGVGEEPQLVGGPLQLAGQPRAAEAALEVGARHDGPAAGVEFVGDAAQEAGEVGPRRAPQRAGGALGGGPGRGDLGGRGVVETPGQLGAGAGVARRECGAPERGARAVDQVVALQPVAVRCAGHAIPYVALAAPYASQWAMSGASSPSTRPRSTMPANQFAAVRRHTSWRAGMLAKARVSSLKPARL
jgi:hypothetical protein